MTMIFYILGWCAIVVAWGVAIAGVSVVAEKSHGPVLGRSLWIAFAVIQSLVCLMAYAQLEHKACHDGADIEICGG